jgi:hypothetical protein
VRPASIVNPLGDVETRWSESAEWLRGKGELMWESFLGPVFSGLLSIPRRLGAMWGSRARLRRHTRAPASWAASGQGVRMLGKIARSVLFVAFFLGVVGVMAFGAVSFAKAVSRGASTVSNNLAPVPTSTQPSDLTIRNNNGGGSTIPPIPEYTLGLWVSNSTPGYGEAMTVYARISDYSLPVSGQTVTFSWNDQTQSAKTDRDGIAVITISAIGTPTQPVVITGSVTIKGNALTNQTFFTIP